MMVALIGCQPEPEAEAVSDPAAPPTAEQAADPAPAEEAPEATEEAVAASASTSPAEISFGEEVALTDHLASDQFTVFDFFSEYCPPCVQMMPMMEKLHRDRDDVTVVKVNINRPSVEGIDWQSPVARQYGLESVPHFKIYGPDGALVAEGEESFRLLEQWLGH